jgi:hypothetical protein
MSAAADGAGSALVASDEPAASAADVVVLDRSPFKEAVDVSTDACGASGCVGSEVSAMT